MSIRGLPYRAGIFQPVRQAFLYVLLKVSVISVKYL